MVIRKGDQNKSKSKTACSEQQNSEDQDRTKQREKSADTRAQWKDSCKNSQQQHCRSEDSVLPSSMG